MEKARIRSFKWWQFHHALWRYKYMVAAIVVLGTSVAVFYTSRITRQYRATASALVDNFSNINNPDVGPTGIDFTRAHKILAESAPVKEKACVDSGLSPVQYGLASFEARADGLLLYFSVTDSDRKVVPILANAWASVFIEELGLRAKSGSETQLKQYSDQINEYQAKLDEINKKKREFNKKVKFDPEYFRTNPILTQVADFELAKRKAEDELRTIEQELKVITDQKLDSAMLTQLPHAIGDTTFMARK
jgi:hypothetical protein